MRLFCKEKKFKDFEIQRKKNEGLMKKIEKLEKYRDFLCPIDYSVGYKEVHNKLLAEAINEKILKLRNE